MVQRGQVDFILPASGAVSRSASSRSVAALLVFYLIIPGVSEGAGDLIHDNPERVMDAVARAASNGDFGSAWTNFQRAYRLMRDSSEAIKTVDSYCRDTECPFIGDVAWILGKEKSDLALLNGICSDESDPCARLVAEAQLAKGFLDETPTPRPFSHEAEIHFIRAEQGDPRPWTLVAIGHKARWGLISSGNRVVEFSARSPVLGPRDYETLGEPIGRDSNTVGTGLTYGQAVLREFTLGAVTESCIPAAARDEDMGYVRMGMNALLRYSKVCFSWSDATLHLGQLGPCTGGEQPFAASLTAKGVPVVETAQGDGPPLRVLVHTGTAKTHCGDRLGSTGFFRFGNHPGLEARCSQEASVARLNGRWDAEIGMDSLMKFNAFGWELNPFRMYFVTQGAMGKSARSDKQGVAGRSYTERLLDETVRAASRGDFQAARDGYNRLFTLMRTSKRARTMHQAYCSRPGGCPDIGVLAWILGKGKPELSFLDGRCEDRTDPTCAHWLERVDLLKAYLNEEPENSPYPPHDVEIEFIHADLNDLRPWMITQVGGKPIWAMMDTGGDVTFIPKRSSILTQADHLTYGELRAVTEADGIVREHQDAVLHDFTLGLFAQDKVPSKTRHPMGDLIEIGMSVLLRYRQVCFSWSDATLHLDRLGPCAAGEMPFAAELSPRGQPFVQVGVGDGQPLRALVDTGAPETDCQDRFIQRTGGGVFRFGEHPDLVARCGDGSPSLRPAKWVDAVIGMDVLSGFEAVGWELNPFRMYFVPKSADSASLMRQLGTADLARESSFRGHLNGSISRAIRDVHDVRAQRRLTFVVRSRQQPKQTDQR